jgi:predicted acetyltransferase
MPQDVDRQLAEFFIIHGYRGHGVSQCAFEALLASYPPGRWHLRILPGNARARRFWPKALVVAGVTEREEREEDDDVTWRFVSSR